MVTFEPFHDPASRPLAERLARTRTHVEIDSAPVRWVVETVARAIDAPVRWTAGTQQLAEEPVILTARAFPLRETLAWSLGQNGLRAEPVAGGLVITLDDEPPYATWSTPLAPLVHHLHVHERDAAARTLPAVMMAMGQPDPWHEPAAIRIVDGQVQVSHRWDPAKAVMDLLRAIQAGGATTAADADERRLRPALAKRVTLTLPAMPLNEAIEILMQQAGLPCEASSEVLLPAATWSGTTAAILDAWARLAGQEVSVGVVYRPEGEDSLVPGAAIRDARRPEEGNRPVLRVHPLPSTRYRFTAEELLADGDRWRQWADLLLVIAPRHRQALVSARLLADGASEPPPPVHQQPPPPVRTDEPEGLPTIRFSPFDGIDATRPVPFSAPLVRHAWRLVPPDPDRAAAFLATSPVDEVLIAMGEPVVPCLMEAAAEDSDATDLSALANLLLALPHERSATAVVTLLPRLPEPQRHGVAQRIAPGQRLPALVAAISAARDGDAGFALAEMADHLHPVVADGLPAVARHPLPLVRLAAALLLHRQPPEQRAPLWELVGDPDAVVAQHAFLLLTLDGDAADLLRLHELRGAPVSPFAMRDRVRALDAGWLRLAEAWQGGSDARWLVGALLAALRGEDVATRMLALQTLVLRQEELVPLVIEHLAAAADADAGAACVILAELAGSRILQREVRHAAAPRLRAIGEQRPALAPATTATADVLEHDLAPR